MSPILVILKKILLWLMVALYTGMGLLHFVQPTSYLAMMPGWLPAPVLLIYGSGLLEIGLAFGLIPNRTRRKAAWLIVGMLLLYLLLIHLPQTLHFYQTKDAALGPSLVRIVIQFVLIGWAYWYAGPVPAYLPRQSTRML